MVDMPNLQDRIIVKIGSDARHISWLGEAIHALTQAAIADERAAMELQVAVVEALNNVFLHAYDSESGHQITVIWQLSEHALRIEILDHGHSLESLPEPTLSDLLCENGRGLWIIDNCVDEYFYQVLEPATAAASQYGITENHCNILTLIKKLNRSTES